MDVGPDTAAAPGHDAGTRTVLVVLEAVVSAANGALAAAALGALQAMTADTTDSWSHGVYARCAAKLAPSPEPAESHFRDALAHFAIAGDHGEVARTHLEYGEWLRRQRHGARAVSHLRAALDHFGVGHQLRARAERELALAVRRPRRGLDGSALTAQELAVAELAGAGARNSEVAAALFLSPHTVDYHLRKVFQKLGISSRRDLAKALAGVRHPGAPSDE